MTISMGLEESLGGETAEASLPERTVSKTRRFFSSLLVVLWVLLVMIAYFSQYLQPLCTLLDVPVLCTP